MNCFVDSAASPTFLLILIFRLSQVKLPFEKLIHALRNFPEDAMDPDTLLPMAYSIKVHIPFYLPPPSPQPLLTNNEREPSLN